MTTTLFLLLNGLMIYSSLTVAYRYFKESAFSQLLLAAFIIFASQITLSLLFIGLVLRNLSFLFIFLVNAVACFAILWVYRDQTVPAVRHCLVECRRFSSSLFRSRDLVLYLIFLLLGAQAAWILVKIYFLPPHVWDSFAYHLHPVAEWLNQGMLADFIDSPVVRVNRNPLGSKFFHLWTFYLSGDITWFELPQFIFGWVTMLSSYALMIRFEVKRAAALRYAALIYFIPLILVHSRTCQDHLVLTGATMISILFFIELFYKKTGDRLFFFSLSAGILLGIKISSPQVIATLFFVYFLHRFLIAGKSRLDTISPSSDSANPVTVIGWHSYAFRHRKTIFKGIGAGILAFLIGGYWYIRNPLIIETYMVRLKGFLSWKILAAGLVVTGLFFLLRPLYRRPRTRKIFLVTFLILMLSVSALIILLHWPMVESSVIGNQDIFAQLKHASFYHQYPLIKALNSDFVKNIIIFPFRIKDIGNYYTYTPDFINQSGFGIQFFGFGILAYLLYALFLIFNPELRRHIATFSFLYSLILLAGYFVYYYSAVNYRMFMFFPIIGIILWAFLAEKIKFGSWSRRFLDLIILIMILFSAGASFFDGSLDAGRWKTQFTLDHASDRTSAKYSELMKNYPAWQFIDTYLPPNQPVAYSAYYDSWVFPYFDTTLKRKIYHLPSLPGFTLKPLKNKSFQLVITSILLDSLKERGIRFIHINSHGYRHKKELYKKIILDDPRVIQVCPDLYRIRW